jgi:hypothetical protein
MFTIDTKQRPGRMLDSLIRGSNRNGKVVVTVTLRRPDRSTALHQLIRFKVYDSRRGRNAGCRMLAVDLMNGDRFEGTFATKVLEWNLDRDEERDGWNDGRPYSDDLLKYAARAALRYLRGGSAPQPANGTVEVVEQEICACCGRELDRPESIELGVGPECARRVGLEHHYRSSQLARTREDRAARAALLAEKEAMPV